MKALTVWRPWSDAILFGGKRIENRGWAPPMSMLGEVIAIHAGAKYDCGDWPMPGYTPPLEGNSPRGIVGVARIVGWRDQRAWPPSYTAIGQRWFERVIVLVDNAWWCGPVGWLLDEVRALPEPISHPGALNLWRVPDDVVAQIHAQLRGASA